MTGIPHLLVHEHDDNVGVVVVEGLKSGTKMLCCITADNSTFELEAMADVPIGHKVALDDLKKGDTATKYGEDIGKFISDVKSVLLSFSNNVCKFLVNMCLASSVINDLLLLCSSIGATNASSSTKYVLTWSESTTCKPK